MVKDVSDQSTQGADTGCGISGIFEDHYVNIKDRISMWRNAISSRKTVLSQSATIACRMVERSSDRAGGNGRLDAVSNAIKHVFWHQL